MSKSNKKIKPSKETSKIVNQINSLDVTVTKKTSEIEKLKAENKALRSQLKSVNKNHDKCNKTQKAQKKRISELEKALKKSQGKKK